MKREPLAALEKNFISYGVAPLVLLRTGPSSMPRFSIANEIREL
jgi:hypothetical protein